MVELLAPARDFIALEAALKNGANAVYLGLEGYNMRAHTNNFSLDNIKEVVERCHSQGSRIYLCTNTVMRDEDIKNLKTILPEIKSAGVDAVIASDLGVLKIAHDVGIDVHLSVQANISNQESLKLLQEMGVKRVILSRELSLHEIKKMALESPLELEVFVHGAMCLAISGRCFLSSYLYGKNANCGECLQPCRKEWKLICEDEEDNSEISLGRSLGKTEDNQFKGDCNQGFKGHLLSPQDLCMIEHIPELIEAGISSFKIEGRARPADYVATVTKTYREAIDSYENGQWKFQDRWLDELRKVYHRGFDTGFYFKNPHHTSDYNQATCAKQDIGEVVNYYSKVKAAEIRLWNPLEVGDEIIVQGPTTGSVIQIVESLQIRGNPIQKVGKNENVGLLLENKVRPGDLVYKRAERT
ncbi:MAG: U32 family peptidase [Methanobacterium sp.]|nr:U32 family peptidase [Methanobacterium sp.]